METFAALMSTKSEEPFDYSILENELDLSEYEGIFKVEHYIYILEKNCKGIFGLKQKQKEWEQFRFRVMHYNYVLTGECCDYEMSDSAKSMFEYYWNIAVMKHADEQKGKENAASYSQVSSALPVLKKTESKQVISRSGLFHSLKTTVETVAPLTFTAMLLFTAPKMPSVSWIGFGLLSSYYLLQKMCKNDKRVLTETTDFEAKEKSSEDALNAYIRLISCSICYKSADPSSYKTDMKQFGCRHAICTNCSLELIRHHWNDRSENRPAFRCPMCCQPSRTEPLGLHYV